MTEDSQAVFWSLSTIHRRMPTSHLAVAKRCLRMHVYSWSVAGVGCGGNICQLHTGSAFTGVILWVRSSPSRVSPLLKSRFSSPPRQTPTSGRTASPLLATSIRFTSDTVRRTCAVTLPTLHTSREGTSPSQHACVGLSLALSAAPRLDNYQFLV